MLSRTFFQFFRLSLESVNWTAERLLSFILKLRFLSVLILDVLILVAV